MRETAGRLGEVYARNENNKGPTRGGEGEMREAVVAFRQVQTTLTQKSRKMLHCHSNSPVH